MMIPPRQHPRLHSRLRDLDQPIDLQHTVERAIASRPHRARYQPLTASLAHLPLVLGDESRIAADFSARLDQAARQTDGQALRITAALVAHPSSTVRLELTAGTWRSDVSFAVAGAVFPRAR